MDTMTVVVELELSKLAFQITSILPLHFPDQTVDEWAEMTDLADARPNTTF
jgi:hypothetical protein